MKAFKLLTIDDNKESSSLYSKKNLPPFWEEFFLPSKEVTLDLEKMNESERDFSPTLPPFHAVLIHMKTFSSRRKQRQIFHWIRCLKEKYPLIEFIGLFENKGEENFMEDALRSGVGRYLKKPYKNEELFLYLNKIETLWDLQPHNSYSHEILVGESGKTKSIRRQIAELRGEGGPILIEGESGTGKELITHLLHKHSRGPLMSLNLAAIPENLFESEMFGHVKGAFTGAQTNQLGLVETAHEGDLFLDEMEALSLTLQAKLLRFLETGEFRKLGSQKLQHVNVRVIVATNKNLDKMVREGKFREDLLWRLEAKKIRIPPLRERKRDIIPLIEYFLKKDKIRKKTLNQDALKVIEDHLWPGNIRQLKQFCEKLLLFSPLPTIRRKDVLKLVERSGSSFFYFENRKDLDFSKGLPSLLREHEASLIDKCLDKYNDVDKSAQIMKISRSSLYKKIKDHGLEWKHG